MVIVVKKTRNSHSYYPLIDAAIRSLIPGKYHELGQFADARTAAHILEVEPEQLYDFIVKSPTIYAVVIDTGEMFVHPEGLIRVLRKRTQSHIQKAQREIRRHMNRMAH